MKRIALAFAFLLALAIGAAFPLRIADAQFIDRIVRGCTSGAVTQASVIVNPNGNGNVNVTPCTGGSLTVNGVPVVPGGTTPGGASGSVQYNNAGAFGGFGSWNGSLLNLSTFVVKAAEFDSDVANIANNGTIRFAKTDFIGWRNQLNNGNVTLGIDSSNRIAATTFAGAFVGNLTGIASGNELPLTFTSPLIRTVNTITCQAASALQAGCLSSADWSTFNSKQAAGNYITALTGDGTASGPGSAALTLASVVSAGSCTSCNLTYDAKGRITVAASGGGVTSVSGTSPIVSSGGSTPTISFNTDAAPLYQTGFGAPVANAILRNVFLSNAGSGDVDLYTCPANKRCAFGGSGVWNSAGTTTTFRFQIKISGSYYRLAANATVNTVTFSGSGNPNNYIAEAGEIISINTSQAGLNVWLRVLEFDNTSPLRTYKLTNPVSGDNTLYTVPAAKSAETGSANGPGSVSYSNASGSARTLTLFCVPSGGSSATGNKVQAAFNVPDASQSGQSICPMLSTGDFLVVNLDANSVSGFLVWVNVFER